MPTLQPETQLRQQDQYPVWHPFTPLLGSLPELEVVSAKGAELHLEGGRTIIDAVSSWWVNLHGHAHPAIAEAISQQAHQLEQVIFAGFTHKPAVNLAQLLIDHIPGNHTKVFYSDDGSTAVEVALKMAMQYWYNRKAQKSVLVSLQGAYHGDTFGAMSVADRTPFNQPFAPYLFQVVQLPISSATSIDEPLTTADYATLKAFEKQAASGQVAAFIYEPLIQGSNGMRFYRKALLEGLLRIAQQHDIITIADEIMTGFGRTGKLFASEWITDSAPELSPDIVCLSKGLTGGFLPLGATTCKPYIQEAFQHQDIKATFFHGHSYTANPLACAAGIASFHLLQSSSSQDDQRRISQSLAEFAASIQNEEALITVRHLGCVLALEWRTTDATGYFNEARHYLYHWCLERNVLLRPLGNVLYILPPYCITDQQLAIVYKVIRDLLAQLANGPVANSVAPV